ncbi:MAG: restriction endonuclease subunit S [Cyanobacteria bacterium]|nr:restriction endonuclease subunit S [Cyanobacteriota bacterium]
MKWPEAALGEIANLIRGITYKPSDVCDATTPSAVACMRTKNVQEVLDESDIVWIPASLIRNSSKYLNPGDILVSSANSWNLVGKGCWVPELKYRASAGGFISILRGNPNTVDFRYLYHWFVSPQTQAKLRSYSNKTTNISNLDHSRTLATEIPLPPLEEQRRIAAILDKAGSLQKLSQSAITKLHQRLESSFRRLSTITACNCASKRLEEVVEAIIDYRGKSPEKSAEGIPLITARLIKEGRILGATEFIAPESYSEWMRRGMPKQGDVVFTTEAPLGQVAQIDNPDVALAQRLVLLRGKSKELDNTYLRFALRMNSVAEQIRKRATGSTVLGIRQKELRQIEIPLPALEVQRDFARLALAIEGEIQRLRQRADSVQALKDSLANRLMEE